MVGRTGYLVGGFCLRLAQFIYVGTGRIGPLAVGVVRRPEGACGVDAATADGVGVGPDEEASRSSKGAIAAQRDDPNPPVPLEPGPILTTICTMLPGQRGPDKRCANASVRTLEGQTSSDGTARWGGHTTAGEGGKRRAVCARRWSPTPAEGLGSHCHRVWAG